MQRVTGSTIGVFALGFLLAASVSWAQRANVGTGGGSTTQPPGPSGNTTQPGSSGRTGRSPLPTDAQQGNSPDRFPQDLQPIYLSGRVTLDDGTAPPEPVKIERVCNGVARPEGFTDSKGRFSIQLGQNEFAFADASVGDSARSGFGSPGVASGFNAKGAGISERDLATCDLRASLGGYRSDEVSLAGRRALDAPEVGTIVLHRYGNVKGVTVSFTNMAAPKDAQKAYEKGRDAARQQKWDESRKQFEKAVAAYPKYAAAWSGLGETLEQLNDDAGARQAFQKAIEDDERFLPPYVQLAGMAIQRRDWKEAAEMTDQILKLDPVNFPGVYVYNSVAQFNLQDLDTAERSARQALNLDSVHRFPSAYRVLGVILANRGDYAHAADNFRSYLRLAPNSPDAQLARDQLTAVERLAQGSQTGSP